MKNENKSKKRKVLLSLNEEVIELLEKGSLENGSNKSQFITKLLKDNVENRLGKYIVRDIENLLLFLILQNDNIKEINKEDLLNKLDNIYKNTKTIKTIKSILLKEKREKKDKQLKDFWNKILTMLEPKTFVKSIGVNGKYDEKKTKLFLNDLYNLIKQNRNLWNK